jgi:hypothetical protein
VQWIAFRWTGECRHGGAQKADVDTGFARNPTAGDGVRVLAAGIRHRFGVVSRRAIGSICSSATRPWSRGKTLTIYQLQ